MCADNSKDVMIRNIPVEDLSDSLNIKNNEDLINFLYQRVTYLENIVDPTPRDMLNRSVMDNMLVKYISISDSTDYPGDYICGYITDISVDNTIYSCTVQFTIGEFKFLTDMKNFSKNTLVLTDCNDCAIFSNISYTVIQLDPLNISSQYPNTTINCGTLECHKQILKHRAYQQTLCKVDQQWVENAHKQNALIISIDDVSYNDVITVFNSLKAYLESKTTVRYNEKIVEYYVSAMKHLCELANENLGID